MIEGWLLDITSSQLEGEVIAWIVDDGGHCHQCHVKWMPTLHISGSGQRLRMLENWLDQPEIRQRFSIQSLVRQHARLALESQDIHEVLELKVTGYHRLKPLAEHIEQRGGYHHFTLYSVDAHLAQRVLVEFNCVPFSRVKFEEMKLVSLDHVGNVGYQPPFRIAECRCEYESDGGFQTPDDPITAFTLNHRFEQGFEKSKTQSSSKTIYRSSFETQDLFFDAIQYLLNEEDPDILLTHGGDQHLFPTLESHAEKCGFKFTFGRDASPLKATTQARTVWSYGQTLHKYASYQFRGRLHIDMKNSFIVREGGLVGLFELAQQSFQSAQEISRLSPGSVISAIQMRIAMDDGVLVPWKKNRPEDTKTALELLNADRGGLYLDSCQGVFTSVVELDFASLFPSIIATRNISPETLNCACCHPANDGDTTTFMPLDPDECRIFFQQRHVNHFFGRPLFPQASSQALRVPGLTSFTCGRQHGFLGRVVGPLIRRRRELKAQRQDIGDQYDRRQNALKWLLVTCFGYTGYRNARFGRIEAHEAICAWAREILLQTIEAAYDDGWDVLHSIVDCVWLHDRIGRTPEQVLVDSTIFARRMSEKIGIPLEFENIYDVIAFLPSRMHGAGSLTKYWAVSQNDIKVRGIELRQHSTPLWIREFQQKALKLVQQYVPSQKGMHTQLQASILSMYRQEIHRLKQGTIPLNQMVISKRVTKTLNQYRVKNLTYAALKRADARGFHSPPGTKIRYVVVNHKARSFLQRVRLAEELGHAESERLTPCVFHYEALAKRAIWSILAPFGWSDDDIESIGLQTTLDEFVLCR